MILQSFYVYCFLEFLSLKSGVICDFCLSFPDGSCTYLSFCRQIHSAHHAECIHSITSYLEFPMFVWYIHIYYQYKYRGLNVTSARQPKVIQQLMWLLVVKRALTPHDILWHSWGLMSIGKRNTNVTRNTGKSLYCLGLFFRFGVRVTRVTFGRNTKSYLLLCS